MDLNGSVGDFQSVADPGNGFIAELVAWDLEGVVLVRSSVPAMSFARSDYRIRADGVDHWVLNATVQGSARATASGRSTQMVPGSVTVLSLGNALEGRTQGLQQISLVVPRDFCREAAMRLEAANASTLTSGLGQLLADYLVGLERCLPNMTVEDLPALAASLRGMILACVAPGADRLSRARNAISDTLLEQARKIVQRRLLSPGLGAEEICRELGVSRSCLYRLFKPVGGVVHYIRGRRLLDAHAALANPDDRRPIVDIAAERGFVDAAEFSRAFRREFGYRPSDARGRSNVWPLRRQRGGAAVNLHELLRRLQ